ncbi:hypothetical protein VTJ04DRAFT_8445 [Mycothermus thermophilus]|uniref:uncharacterized protein n=1 Tax=Humicola insolens TaxID=85995 RepID=UPI0037421E49
MKKWTPRIEPHNPGLSDPRDTNKPPTAARARPIAETYTSRPGGLDLFIQQRQPLAPPQTPSIKYPNVVIVQDSRINPPQK